MKPRVMFATRELRVVMTSPRWFVLERADGRDAVNRTRWTVVDGAELAQRAAALVTEFGKSLHRREKAMRRARRARGGAAVRVDGIDDGELVRTPADRNISGIPREGQSRARGENVKRAILWQRHGVRDTGTTPEIWGKLPIGFLAWAYDVLQVRGSPRVLHVCSGGLGPETLGVRVDIRPEVRPDVVADGRELPFADDTFDAVLIDPPYSVDYASSLYGTDYPRPSALLREAARVLRPCRRVGIVHFLAPRPVPGLRFVEIHGVTQGLGYRIRALTVFQKEQRGLFPAGGGQ